MVLSIGSHVLQLMRIYLFLDEAKRRQSPDKTMTGVSPVFVLMRITPQGRTTDVGADESEGGTVMMGERDGMRDGLRLGKPVGANTRATVGVSGVGANVGSGVSADTPPPNTPQADIPW